MDERTETTTEVQFRKSRSYLPHLRKVVSCVAARLGMNRNQIEEAEHAVSEVCASSIDTAPEPQDGNLAVKLSTQGTHLMVEITDPSLPLGSACADGWTSDDGQSPILERIHDLTDSAELVRDDECATVRMTKHVQKPETAQERPAAYVAALGTTSLQS